MPARAALLVLLAAASLHAADPKAKEKGKPNRLAKESSPYLLQHAYNPVDWFPWGEEAFAKAKKEGKLVFLSIGYSSCHWCHVMERESFSHPDVAKLLNDNYVCIKVDREERPDVDDVYMTALNVSGESGGWPLSMFLTPEGKPIFGGTYWPREDREVNGQKLIGFKSVLARVTELHKTEKDGIAKQADRTADATAEALERAGRTVPIGPLTRIMVADAVKAFEFDTEHGGLKSARTKFPRVAVWMFLVQQGAKPGNEAVAKQVKLTLDRMALGGIYDQVGGGFHRYSTEKTWTVPHFEKMLYDNAQLVELYAEAYRTNPDPLYKRAIAETLAFVGREMTSPEGGFYSALDADSEGEEGRFYVWTPEELQAAIPAADDREFLKAVYATAATNFEGKYHIFRFPKPPAEVAKELKTTEAELLVRLDRLKAKLFAVRAKRERPFLDTKVITAWNGQMIAAYAKAGEVLKDKAYTAAAAKAADFLLTKLRTKDGRLLRLYATPPGGKPEGRGNAFLDDYAFLVHGLLNLHDATGEKRWLDEAKALTDTLIRWHGDADRGGFYSTSSDHEKLFARGKDSYDGAQPSGNGAAARDLLRVWQKTGDTKYRDWCQKTVKLFSLALRTNPTSAPAVARTLDELLDAGAANPAAVAAKDPDPLVAPKNPKASEDVVKATLKVADGGRAFTVTLATAAPWHVYANPVANKEFEASVTTVEVYVGGKKADAKVEFPAGTVAKDKTAGEYRVYEGTVTITGAVTRGKDDTGELEVRVKLMACKEGVCLLPSTLKLTGK